MGRVQLEPGYVLSVRSYRETSALLEALTPSHGRVGLVARGARGAKSRQRAALQPFQRLLLSWSEHGELGTLTAAEGDGAPAALAGEAIFSGWYANELLLRLTARRDPHPGLFDAYGVMLGALAGGRAAPALRVFEKRLLAELGYAVHLPDDLAPEHWYSLDDDNSVRRVAQGAAGAYRGASLLDLARESFGSDDSLRDARRLLRSALEPHLGGRALRTPDLLRALRATGTPRRAGGDKP